ncbi:MAG: carboxypeptidase regulatory-like domain-containing protein [Rhodocyclaceae bacterium]|nr:carboxypeptidase regulatory-like domain-containing protein [Rhodocyclaceae bacterium]
MNKHARISASIPAAAALLLSGLAFDATAARVAGAVADSAGKPIAGAIVSLTDAKGRAESVYSDAAGMFALDAGLKGTLTLRIRKRYHEDYTAKIAASANGKPMAVKLADITDPKRLSDEAPSLSHFSRIAFDKDENGIFSRPNFARACLSCHSLGNASTRWPRPPEGWMPTVQRMHGYVGNGDQEQMKQRAALLAQAFDGTPVTSRPVVTYDSAISKSKVYQWRLDKGVMPHDAEVSHVNGKVYMSDFMAGALTEFDLKSGRATMFPEPADGSPPGGYFTKIGVPPPYGLMLSHTPHSLAEGKDGKFYSTDSIGCTLTEFDPVTKKFKHYDVGSGALYPHTIRVDAKGVVWFTVIFSNQVGRFDPATQSMKVIQLPATPAGKPMLNMPSPYGIDINPKDGSVWYAQLGIDKIGRIDPLTLEVKEFDSPVRGPRRQRFDAAGKLWVAGFSEGAIARIDVDSWQSKVYMLPRYVADEVPAPYALGVHPQTQEIWVNDSMMDLVWRFIPAEEKFVAYPLPLKGTYTRDFSFTKEGWACTSNNPVPIAVALEGGVPELICIDANGALPKAAPQTAAAAGKGQGKG